MFGITIGLLAPELLGVAGSLELEVCAVDVLDDDAGNEDDGDEDGDEDDEDEGAAEGELVDRRIIVPSEESLHEAIKSTTRPSLMHRSLPESPASRCALVV